MEVATSLLYLDASLEDSEFDHPLIAEGIKRLARRIVQACEGKDAQPLEPWMEELYRRVSERQTMGSVVQELRASLSEAEKHIDQFFRNPAEREVLTQSLRPRGPLLVGFYAYAIAEALAVPRPSAAAWCCSCFRSSPSPSWP